MQLVGAAPLFRFYSHRVEKSRADMVGWLGLTLPAAELIAEILVFWLIRSAVDAEAVLTQAPTFD